LQARRCRAGVRMLLRLWQLAAITLALGAGGAASGGDVAECAPSPRLKRSCATHDGLKRCWYVVLPPPPQQQQQQHQQQQQQQQLPGQLPPLILALHPYGACADEWLARSGWEELAVARGAVLVAPQGAQNTSSALPIPSWNAGGCCGHSDATGVDDVGFLALVLARSVATLGADSSRVFVTGHSNGCAMAQRLGVELSERIAAVACSAFFLLAAAPAAYGEHGRVPVLTVHGRADAVVPYEPSSELRAWATARGWRGAQANLRLWADLNLCSRGPFTEQLDGATRTSFADCDGASEVALVTFDTAVHSRFPDDYVPVTRLAWAFFEGYRRAGGVIVRTGVPDSMGVSNTPRAADGFNTGVLLLPTVAALGLAVGRFMWLRKAKAAGGYHAVAREAEL
jgi:polyhydroxybutyrate depolymerase